MDQASGLRGLTGRGRLSGGGLRVFAFTSGKGGVGKTNLCANFAVAAARRGARVLILDADLGLANVEIIFGLKPRYHLGDLLEGRPIEEVLVQGPPGVSLLAAGSGVQSLTHLSDDDKLRLISALDPLEEQFDLVLIDTGAGIGENVLFFVGAAEEAILVVSPEPTSLVDAYAVVKVLSQQAGVHTFNVVVNPVVDELTARAVFTKLTTVTSRFLSARVRLLGYVPRDENLSKAIMAQRPVCDMFPSSPSARAITGLEERLTAAERAEPVAAAGLKLMWQRLLRESTALAG